MIVFLVLSIFSMSNTYAGEWSQVMGNIQLRASEFLTVTDEYPQNIGEVYISAQVLGEYDHLEFKIAPVYTHSFSDLSKLNESNGHLLSSEVTGEFTSPNVDIKAGLGLISWGAADGLNPTNGFQAFDLSDPAFAREISQSHVGIKFHPSEGQDFIFELIVSPEGNTDRLPLSQDTGSINPQDSRWGVILPTAIELGESSTVPLLYNLKEENKNSKTDFATRLRFLGVRGWDFSLVVGQFRRKKAVLRYKLTGDAADPNLPLTLKITPYYARRNMIGGDATGTLGEYGLRFEAAKYTVRDSDREFGYDSLIGNLGIDRIWYDFYKNYSLYVNLAYIEINNSKSAIFDNDSVDLAISDSYSTVKLELRSDKWVHALDYFATMSKNFITSFSTKYSYTDALEVGLGLNFINSNKEEGVGLLDGNHRLIGRLNYIF